MTYTSHLPQTALLFGFNRWSLLTKNLMNCPGFKSRPTHGIQLLFISLDHDLRRRRTGFSCHPYAWSLRVTRAISLMLLRSSLFSTVQATLWNTRFTSQTNSCVDDSFQECVLHLYTLTVSSLMIGTPRLPLKMWQRCGTLDIKERCRKGLVRLHR